MYPDFEDEIEISQWALFVVRWDVARELPRLGRTGSFCVRVEGVNDMNATV